MSVQGVTCDACRKTIRAGEPVAVLRIGKLTHVGTVRETVATFWHFQPCAMDTLGAFVVALPLVAPKDR